MSNVIQRPTASPSCAPQPHPISFRQLAPDIPSTTYATFGLYRYPAKFIPQVIAYVLKQYASQGMSLLDPFAGYGTAGVVARVHGHPYELWDLNPLVQHLHPVATMEPVDRLDLVPLLKAMASSRQEFVPDWPNLSYWYPQEFLPLLYRAWGFYHALEDPSAQRLLLVPLLKATRLLSYNDAQRQKLSRSPKEMARVKALRQQDWQGAFFATLKRHLSVLWKRLEEYWALKPQPVQGLVRGGVDSLSMELEVERDILVTSPPYLQAQEYIRNSKMDLYWLGYSDDAIRRLGKLELPYRQVESCSILSETYREGLERIDEPPMRLMYQSYFNGVLGALTRLQEKVRSHMALFVGPASVRARPVPIDQIFVEHFTALGWSHEATLVDNIVGRVMFSYGPNPATGLADPRVRREHLVVLRR